MPCPFPPPLDRLLGVPIVLPTRVPGIRQPKQEKEWTLLFYMSVPRSDEM